MFLLVIEEMSCIESTQIKMNDESREMINRHMEFAFDVQVSIFTSQVLCSKAVGPQDTITGALPDEGKAKVLLQVCR